MKQPSITTKTLPIWYCKHKNLRKTKNNFVCPHQLKISSFASSNKIFNSSLFTDLKVKLRHFKMVLLLNGCLELILNKYRLPVVPTSKKLKSCLHSKSKEVDLELIARRKSVGRGGKHCTIFPKEHQKMNF